MTSKLRAAGWALILMEYGLLIAEVAQLQTPNSTAIFPLAISIFATGLSGMTLLWLAHICRRSCS